MELKDKIMLHGFREVKCQWEVGEVGRWERWKVMRWEGGKGGRVMRWQGGEGRRVVRWEVPGFTEGWETQGESKILSFYFRC